MTTLCVAETRRCLLVRVGQPAFGRKRRLLEIGPDTGEFLELARRQFEVEGIDISTHALHYVKPELRTRIRVGNIEETPLPDKRYGAVVAFNVLEHLSQPLGMLHKLRRALFPHGGPAPGDASTE